MFLPMRTPEKMIFVDWESAREMPGQIGYDCGIAVTDRTGRIYEEYNLVNSDVFYGAKDDMQSCYYAHKLPKYHKAIWAGERKVVNTYQIKKLIAELQEKHHTKIVCAYNTHFDKTCGNNTESFATEGKYKYLYPKGTIFWDAWLMAKDTICMQAGYKKFCAENGFMTKHKTPRPQTKAETVYRFITKDTSFEEEHQGLDDVRIEIAIMAECFKKHKKMRKVLYTKKA